MTNEQLLEAVRLHALWRQRDPAGRRLELRGEACSHAALRGARLTSSLLRDVDLRGADLHGISFRKSELEGVRFDGALLQEADFSECTLRDCHFESARIEDGAFPNSRVVDSSFIAATMTRANLAKSVFEQTSLAHVTMAGGHLLGWEARHCDLRGCDLSGAELAAATFSDTDLRWTNVAEAHLYGTLLVRRKVAGMHGTPFLAEHLGDVLDFSPDADGSDIGSLERLRVQLDGGSGPGRGRYGIGTTPSLYRAYEVTNDGAPYFSICREPGAVDVLRIRRLFVEDVVLVVEFEQLDPRFEQWLASDLIDDVFLQAFLKDVYRGKVLGIDFRNLTNGCSHSTDYGVHQPPARPRQQA